MSRVLVWLAVGAIGGAGALARFLLGAFVTQRVSGRFPTGTLAVNLSGSVLLGLLAGLSLHGDALLFAGTALLGSYTTFSTWMFESQRLGEDGHGRLLALNVGGSLVLGLGAVALGHALGVAL